MISAYLYIVFANAINLLIDIDSNQPLVGCGLPPLVAGGLCTSSRGSRRDLSTDISVVECTMNLLSGWWVAIQWWLVLAVNEKERPALEKHWWVKRMGYPRDGMQFKIEALQTCSTHHPCTLCEERLAWSLCIHGWRYHSPAQVIDPRTLSGYLDVFNST